MTPNLRILRVEEHGIDLYGQKYSFLVSSCERMIALGKMSPSNEIFVICINAGFMWSNTIAGIAYGTRQSVVWTAGCLALPFIIASLILLWKNISELRPLITALAFISAIIKYSYYLLHRKEY